MENQATSPIQQSVEPVQQMPPTRSRGPIITAVVVGILVLAGGVFAYSKLAGKPAATPTASATPDATAGWKTYTNAQFGFEFKYPAEGSVRESVDHGGPADGPPIAFNVSYDGPQGSQRFNLQILYTIAPQQLEDFACPSTEEGASCFTNYRMINGVRFIVVTYAIHEGEGTGTKDKDGATIRNGDGQLFRFYTGFDPELQKYSLADLAKNVGLFDQILSTFRFTSTDSTSTWKTYADAQYGYSVKYPASWSPADCSVGSAGNCQGFVVPGASGFSFAVQENIYPTLAAIKAACQKTTYNGQTDCLSYTDEQVVLRGTSWWRITEMHHPDLTGGHTKSIAYWTSQGNNTFFVQTFSDIDLQMLSTFKFTK